MKFTTAVVKGDSIPRIQVAQDDHHNAFGVVEPRGAPGNFHTAQTARQSGRRCHRPGGRDFPNCVIVSIRHRDVARAAYCHASGIAGRIPPLGLTPFQCISSSIQSGTQGGFVFHERSEFVGAVFPVHEFKLRKTISGNSLPPKREAWVSAWFGQTVLTPVCGIRA